MPLQKNDFAIVVGLSQYPSPDMRPLSGPPHDAQNVAAWLTREDGGGLPPENVTKILSSDFGPFASPDDAEPSPADIDKAFRKLRNTVKNAYHDLGLKARRLTIFMAGHGFCRDDESAALLAANGDYDANINYCIDPKPYAQWFRMECYFEEVVLWMDCCRDLHASALTGQFMWPTSPVADPEAARSRWFYGFAAKANAQSRELPLPPPDGTTQGLFTYALLKALDNAPGDADGNVTGASLSGYVYKQLQELAGPGKTVQEPYMPVDLAHDVVLVQRPAPSVVAPAQNPADAPLAPSSPPLDNQYKITFVPPVSSPDATIDVWDATNRHVGTFPAEARLKLKDLPVGLVGLRRSDDKAGGFTVMSADETVEITLDWNGEVTYERW